MRKLLDEGNIVIAAGFQGIDEHQTSPPWAAAAATRRPWPWRPCCKADQCEIYTDVDGVYTTDPRSCPKPAAWRGSATTRCWNWPASAPA